MLKNFVSTLVPALKHSHIALFSDTHTLSHIHTDTVKIVSHTVTHTDTDE